MARQLHVGNLPSSATEEDLLVKFGQYGVVESVKIMRDAQTGRSRGFGFVDMSSDAEAQAAINRLNFSQYGERTMSVGAVRVKIGDS